MTREEAIERARKLLALASNNQNEHEAALAAARAAEILARWNLSAEALDDEGEADDEREACGSHEIDAAGGRATWRGVLVSGIAKLHGCKAYRNGPRLMLVGRPSRVQEVAYLYRWLVAEVERLARRRSGNGRAWLNAYRHGAVSAILMALREAHATAAREARDAAPIGGASALVVANALETVRRRSMEADAWAAAHLRLGRATRARVSDGGGYAAGRADGANVYSGRSVGAIGGGRLRIASGH